MNQNRVTLLEVYERHVKAGTCKFKSWCELVEYVEKHHLTAEQLNKLHELSESSIEPTKPPKTEAKKEPESKGKPKASEPAKEG